MPDKVQNWGQTAVMLVAIIGGFTTSTLYLQNTYNHLGLEIKLIQQEQLYMHERLTIGGWSRQEHARWVDSLRKESGHNVPGLEE